MQDILRDMTIAALKHTPQQLRTLHRWCVVEKDPTRPLTCDRTSANKGGEWKLDTFSHVMDFVTKKNPPEWKIKYGVMGFLPTPEYIIIDIDNSPKKPLDESTIDKIEAYIETVQKETYVEQSLSRRKGAYHIVYKVESPLSDNKVIFSHPDLGIECEMFGGSNTRNYIIFTGAKKSEGISNIALVPDTIRAAIQAAVSTKNVPTTPTQGYVNKGNQTPELKIADIQGHTLNDTLDR